MVIESRQNRQVKELFSLKTNKGRRKLNQYYVEGIKIVFESLKIPDRVTKIFYRDGFGATIDEKKMLDQVEKLNIESITLNSDLFNEMSDTQESQGVLAVVTKENWDLNKLLGEVKEKSTLLILDRIQDPGNMGTIIRTAEAFGVSGIILCKGSVDPYNSKVIRSTMGSVLRMPLVFSNDISLEIELLKNEKFDVLVTSLDANKNLDKMSFDNRNVLVIGNEANGVSDEIQSASDKLLKIPMIGKSESLNAAIATSIVLYDLQTKVFLSN